MSHILIVDEQAEICYLLERMLRRSGYTTHAVATGGEAAQNARLAAPDLVLLDFVQWNVPLRQVLARLSESLPNTRTPFVVMSTNAPIDMADLAGLNVAGFLHKPFLMASLLAAVECGLKIGYGCALAR